jgi:hypothetical protein
MKYGGFLLIYLLCERSEHVGMTRLEFQCLGAYMDECSFFYCQVKLLWISFDKLFNKSLIQTFHIADINL